MLEDVITGIEKKTQIDPLNSFILR